MGRFQIGDRVSFDHNGQPQSGVVESFYMRESSGFQIPMARVRCDDGDLRYAATADLTLRMMMFKRESDIIFMRDQLHQDGTVRRRLVTATVEFKFLCEDMTNAMQRGVQINMGLKSITWTETINGGVVRTTYLREAC